jgi:hypothetical protein
MAARLGRGQAEGNRKSPAQFPVLHRTYLVYRLFFGEAAMERDEVGIERLLDALIEREGGFVDHPSDRGGATRFGVTEAVARAHGYRGPMRTLPREEAQAIYRRLYWLRPRFDQVAARAPRIAAELFDTGVNMGPAVAATFLQRALTALNRNGKDFGNCILYKAGFMSDSKTERPAPTDEVTSSMKDAGATILRVFGQSLDPEALAEMVFQAMKGAAVRAPEEVAEAVL